MLARRRHLWRLFCLLLSVLASATMSHAQALAMTNISDVVYRADGTPASGVLFISWPAFSTSDGKPVASGTKNVTLGAQGALSVSLAPKAGATPAATYYTVVYQLSDTVKTEFWTVGTTSPTTIAAVRTTLGTGSAAQMASRQYVDSVVGSKATDTAVVHKKRCRGNQRHQTIFDSSQRTRTRAGVNDGIDCQPRHCRRRKVQGRPGEGDRRNCGVFERLDLGQGKPALGVLENIRKTRRRNEKASFGSPFDGDQRRLHSQIIWAGLSVGTGKCQYSGVGAN